jgi:hypothetical protein
MPCRRYRGPTLQSTPSTTRFPVAGPRHGARRSASRDYEGQAARGHGRLPQRGVDRNRLATTGPRPSERGRASVFERRDHAGGQRRDDVDTAFEELAAVARQTARATEDLSHALSVVEAVRGEPLTSLRTALGGSYGDSRLGRSRSADAPTSTSGARPAPAGTAAVTPSSAHSFCGLTATAKRLSVRSNTSTRSRRSSSPPAPGQTVYVERREHHATPCVHDLLAVAAEFGDAALDELRTVLTFYEAMRANEDVAR